MASSSARSARSVWIVWMGLGVLYALFFAWYTSCGGPLTDEEIARYVEVLAAKGADPERLALWKHFMETDTGDDFAMLNVIELRETPLQVEGVEPGETSEAVLRRYTTPFLAMAVRSAAHPVLLGRAAAPSLDLWGIEGAERWTNGGLVRYRSRRDLLEQVLYTRDAGVHDFKIAAMEKTIAFPLDPWFQLGDPRLVLALLLLVVGLAWHLRCALSAQPERPASRAEQEDR
jgi:hypothetical protein